MRNINNENKFIWFPNENGNRFFWFPKEKKADISILLLVLMTVILVVTVTFIFYKNTQNSGLQIKDSKFLDEIYMEENQVNFYIDEIMDRSVAGINGDRSQFIQNFRNELPKYIENGEFLAPELKQLGAQLDGDNVRIDNGIVYANFSIKIEKFFGDNIMVSYLYEKEFRKTL